MFQIGQGPARGHVQHNCRLEIRIKKKSDKCSMELPSGNERQKDERSDDRMEYPEQCHQEPMLYTRLSHFWGKNTSGKKSFSIMSELLNSVPHQIQPSSIQYTAWNCSNIVEWPFYFALFSKVSDVVFTTVSRVSGRPCHVF